MKVSKKRLTQIVTEELREAVHPRFNINNRLDEPDPEIDAKTNPKEIIQTALAFGHALGNYRHENSFFVQEIVDILRSELTREVGDAIIQGFTGDKGYSNEA